MEECSRVLLVSPAGEVVLKSRRVRPRFQRRLAENLRRAFDSWGAECSEPRPDQARLVASCRSSRDYEVGLEAALHVFGVHGATVACRVEYSSLEDLARRVAVIASGWVSSRRFAVRAKRGAGVEGFTSIDAARAVGAALLSYSAGVDLENPEIEVHLEIRRGYAYLHRGYRRGPGGLPVGVEGRALVLFSGGLDSALAAWMAAKRGAETDLLHYVVSEPASLLDALRVARRLSLLWLHGYTPRLLVVDLRRAAAEARRLGAGLGYQQVLLRMAMYDAAARLAEALGYHAVYTGESVGQVSSQTLRNIYAMARALPLQVPLIRPLAGMDKEEIVEMDRRIGVYEEASKTREYCMICSGLVSTRADPGRLASLYEAMRGLVLSAAESYVEIRLGDSHTS